MSKKNDFKVSLSINKYNETIMSLEFIENNMKYIIPKIILNDINIEKEQACLYPENSLSRNAQMQILKAYIKFPILSNEKEVLFTVMDLNYEEPKELTIKEIEEKLGYKVKIKGE